MRPPATPIGYAVRRRRGDAVDDARAASTMRYVWWCHDGFTAEMVAVFSTTIETMLDVRRAILDGSAKLHRVLLQVVQHGQICRRLMTVPGVGLVAALSFKVGVEDPLRFTRSRTTAPFANRQNSRCVSVVEFGDRKLANVLIRQPFHSSLGAPDNPIRGLTNWVSTRCPARLELL
jgi:hypothetical protein